VLRTLYSVGHSNHSVEVFLDIVRREGIQAVADVRSQPYSRYAAHFSRDALTVILERAGIRYVFLGTELGGRPDGEEFYDDEGHVLYGKRAESDQFLTGIERLEAGASRLRIAIMSARGERGCDKTHPPRREDRARRRSARARERERSNEPLAVRGRGRRSAVEIYSIGFTRKTAAEFFGAPRSAGIRQLLDVRLNNS
jgi:hypothetical protein